MISIHRETSDCTLRRLVRYRNCRKRYCISFALLLLCERDIIDKLHTRCNYDDSHIIMSDQSITGYFRRIDSTRGLLLGSSTRKDRKTSLKTFSYFISQTTRVRGKFGKWRIPDSVQDAFRTYFRYVLYFLSLFEFSQ